MKCERTLRTEHQSAIEKCGGMSREKYRSSERGVRSRVDLFQHLKEVLEEWEGQEKGNFESEGRSVTGEIVKGVLSPTSERRSREFL